ncbi:putative RING-H2 finger protein ATL49 [Hyalella azteca]|uniref:RING-H2 finger protein ATL49 n=1 Tax=Hyalella azteca TaxID=294128 RepID=A0A979FQ58_HYAAZ|nr:putative RING-H2 finger protein ATL49 [Hyalella azteca]
MLAFDNPTSDDEDPTAKNHSLMPTMHGHLIYLVVCINSILEMRAMPIFVRGNVLSNLRSVHTLNTLYKQLLYSPVFGGLVNCNPELVTKLSQSGHFLLQRQVASVLFAVILSGLADQVSADLPLSSSAAALKVVCSPSSNECGMCLDVITDDTDYAMLTSCSHVFCIRCANEWFTRTLSCPMCRARRSFWLPRSLVLSYLLYAHANNRLLDVNFDVQVHLKSILVSLLKP